MLLRTTLLALLLLLACLTTPTQAQTFRDEIAPALSSDDYKLIVARLELSSEQRTAADALYDGYIAEHSRNVKAFKQVWKDHNASVRWVEGERITDPAADDALLKGIKLYHELKPAAQQAFLRDLRATLEDSQAAGRWDRIERFVRRQLMNGLSFRGVVEWQRPDLLRGVHQLELAPEHLAKVQPLLDEYELLIDKQLLRMEPLRGKLEDESALTTWNQAVLDLRAINRRYLRVISQELPAEQAAALTRWARNLAYWHMQSWDRNIIHTAVEEAERLPTLTPEQRSRIDAFVAEMEKRTAEIRKQAEPAFDEADEKMLNLSEREWKAVQEGKGGEHPGFAVDARFGQEFSDLYEAWMAQLENMLTTEQRKELWPPKGSFREWAIERSRKVFE
jgi:hypothetical protein